MLKKFMAIIAFATFGLMAVPSAHATNTLATAIGGYDAVSYFKNGEPAQGHAKFHVFWNGAVWFFANEQNRDDFAASPATYAPQYDGYCAWAASQNYKRPGDPNVWQIVDNKLYLKVHEGAQKKWRKDIPTHITQGDENWVKIAPY